MSWPKSPVSMRRGGAHAGDVGDQEPVQQCAADEQHRPRQQRADERPDIGPEEASAPNPLTR